MFDLPADAAISTSDKEASGSGWGHHLFNELTSELDNEFFNECDWMHYLTFFFASDLAMDLTTY